MINRITLLILLIGLACSCASKLKTYSIVNVILIEDRDGRNHIYERELKEGKALWCVSHEQYEKIEVKRLHNQANLIKEHAND
jgi:hypothetical protein